MGNNTNFYPIPYYSGNVNYIGFGNYHNALIEHVAESTLQLQPDVNYWEAPERIMYDTFYTYKHNHGAVSWTATLGIVREISDLNNIVGWNTTELSYNQTDTMVATCFAYSKQVPLQKSYIGNKATTKTYDNNAVVIGKITPNIVTNTAITDIQTATEGYLNVSIYDLTGNKVANITNQYVNENMILQVNFNSLSHLSAGSYMATVSIGNETVVRKFIKEWNVFLL